MKNCRNASSLLPLLTCLVWLASCCPRAPQPSRPVAPPPPAPIVVRPAIPTCLDPGPQPVPATAQGAELVDIIRAQADALLNAWRWADAAEQCLDAMRAAGKVRP